MAPRTRARRPAGAFMATPALALGAWVVGVLWEEELVELAAPEVVDEAAEEEVDLAEALELDFALEEVLEAEAELLAEALLVVTVDRVVEAAELELEALAEALAVLAADEADALAVAPETTKRGRKLYSLGSESSTISIV